MELTYKDEDEIASDYDEARLLRGRRNLPRRKFHVNSDNEAPLLPDFVRERFRRVQRKYLPTALQDAFRFLSLWSKGPMCPEMQKIAPVLAPLQHASLRLGDGFMSNPKRQAALVGAIFLAWASLFFAFVWAASLLPDIDGYGQPNPIRCMQQAWSVKDDCGLDGIDCRPFANTTFAFQCHPGCATKQVWYPHTVGDQELVYKQLVVGGASTEFSSASIYRADSSICQAAIHAGVLSDSHGGPVVLRLLGEHEDFQASIRNGVQSVGFDADFPKAFAFVAVDSVGIGTFDTRWPILFFSVLITATISILTTSPVMFFTPIFTILFMHASLVSDTPELPTLPALLSSAAERFLPASFIAFVLYSFCVRPQLLGLTAQLEKTILWLGAAWFGVLENYTLDYIPLRRLTPGDIQSQQGAVTALAIVSILIASIATGQIYYLRLEGRLVRYLKVYAFIAGMLVCAAAVPSLHLRIHHYILALLLLPGTAIQTRPSLLYQGLLVGLFINGVARWGFASILQTDAALRDVDGPYGSALPKVTAAVTSDASAIEFQWSWPPEPYHGLSMLVNDVERYRWYTDEAGISHTWRSSENRRSRTYFRFAYVTDGHAVDYTRAGIWEMDGTWNASLWDQLDQ